MITQEGTLTDDTYGEALAPGSKLLSGQYEIIRYLSSGGFGITYLAKDSLNRTVVIKECYPEAFCSRINKTVRPRTKNYADDFRSIVQLFIREAHSLSRLDHRSVVGVHQVFEDNETAYMALDLVDGKDLLEIIESGSPKMTATQVTTLTLALLDAIAHVHGQDLLHRDISPDNILVDKLGKPVLIDFGAAREEASRKSRVLSSVLVVKDGYSPQEFYVAGSQQTPASDLYALAASLSHLITGEAPPNSQARLAALAANQPDLFEPLTGRFPEYSEAYLAAIDKAMNIIPADRIQSAEEWSILIDRRKRAEVARTKAQNDETINLKVMDLVKEVNQNIVTVADIPCEGSQDEEVTPEPSVATTPEEALERTRTRPLKDPKYDEQFLKDLFGTDDDEDLEEDALIEDDLAHEAVEEEPSTQELSGEGKESELEKTELAVQIDKVLQIEASIQAPSELTTKSEGDVEITLDDADEHADISPEIAQYARLRTVRRSITIPTVLLAYFFFGHVAFQYDALRAATLGPIITMGEEYGYWEGEPKLRPSPSRHFIQ